MAMRERHILFAPVHEDALQHMQRALGKNPSECLRTALMGYVIQNLGYQPFGDVNQRPRAQTAAGIGYLAG